MHLKQKGYCFGVLLIYTITTTTLPSVGLCEPVYPSHQNSNLALHNVRNSVLTRKSLSYPSSSREGKRPQHIDSQQGEQEESRNLPASDHPENRDGARTKTSGARPGQRLGPKMAFQSFKNHHKPKQTERERMYSSLNPSIKDCSKGKTEHVVQGKFYIIGQVEPNIPNVGYQSDSAVSVQAEGGQARIRDQRFNGSEESWQRLRPVVECGDDAMTLIVRRRRAVQLQLDRANESSVPLSQLPPECGYSVQTTWRDLSLIAQYDACHVTQEDDGYMLPLLWRGTPVKMSCPVSHTQPHVKSLSSLCCSSYAMTVKVQGLSATEELRINVRGDWTPLLLLAEQCGYTLDRRDADIVITAPYLTCGITIKDGKYTLPLQTGEKTFTLSCPYSHPEELPPTPQPLVDSTHHLGRGPTERFPWTPPFYLAPLYYPHPTYHHKYLRSEAHDAHNPATPPFSTPDPTIGSQPLPSVDSQPHYPEYYSHQIPVRESYKQFGALSSLSSTDEMEDSSQMYPDLQHKQGSPVADLSEKHSATPSPFAATGFPLQVEAPSLQPPSHAFNPYYHYYHHPKIPLPDPPQDPDPGPEAPEEMSSSNSHNSKFQVQPSEANSDQFPQPVPEAASHPYILPRSPEFVDKAPAPHAPYPQPSPYHYYHYFPHIARGEAKRLAPLHRDMAAQTNLSSSMIPVHDKYSVDQPKADKMIYTEKRHPDWIKNPHLSEDDDVTPELDDKKRHSTPAVQPPLPPSYPPEPDPIAALSPAQPSFPIPSSHNPLPYPHYNYHPYYHYYHMYYGPDRLQSADNRVSPTSSKEDPLSQASSLTAQHPSYHKHQSPTFPTETTYDDQNGRLPYYHYYHLFSQAKVSQNDQELHPAGSMEVASSHSESQPPSDSDHSAVDLLVRAAEARYPSIPQPVHSPLPSFYSHYMTQQHPGGEEAEELDDERRDCTMGQYFVFAVPDAVVEPTVAPAHPSEDSNESCRLQRLTSDPNFYIVPLDGCGVNKHVFGQTEVHLLEVQGIYSPQHDHNSPVRLMVECSSSPGSPGEVRLHVMDQPPPSPIQSTPATVTVQLRIATDDSFTSYHPEAHLPLSLMRGRPLYLEVSLLDPPEPDLVLLVHSCLAYTQAPYSSWMPIYDGNFQLQKPFRYCVLFSCPSRGDSQLLPSPRSNPHHIRRILISSFLSLPSESPSYMAKGGHTLLEDPEIYLLCLTEVCSGGDCTVGCINSPSDV